MRSLEEIRRIAKERDTLPLHTLSDLELNVLLATLNRYRPEAAEEDAFVDFYLKVADRMRSRGA